MIALLVLAVVTSSPRIEAHRTPTPPRIDGQLEGDVWNGATVSDGFVQRFPDQGQPPTERTTVQVMYDSEALYVGVACQQRRAPIWRRLTRRDRELRDADLVAITVGSRNDRDSAFRFAVNVAGVLADGIYYNDTSYDSSWDENWEAATHATADGWSAEFRIPLRVLRFDALSKQAWAFNVERIIAAKGETSVWTYIPRAEAGYVSRLGQVERLVDLPHTNTGIELRPFVVASFWKQTASYGLPRAMSNPAALAQSWSRADGTNLVVAGSMGADARVYLTRDLTLDGTINPDFAQVESDQLVLNLSTIETFFPEKRPFFLEGLDIFATPFTVLYTRRIGAVGPKPALVMGETAQEVPGESGIPAAMKLAGRVRGLSLGLLTAMTATNKVSITDATGNVRARLVDPPTLFNVLRLRAPVGRGHLGFIGSATNSFERPEYNSTTIDGAVACPGRAEARSGDSCFHDAYVTGLDGRWQSPTADYVLRAQTVASLVTGGERQTLLDGTTVSSGDIGEGASLLVAKQGGGHWQWWLNAHHHSRKLQLNDAGYLSRQNEAGANFDLHYVTKTPFWLTLETNTRAAARHWRNLDGLVLQSSALMDSTVTFRNHWLLSALVQKRQPYFDDREVGDGTALERAGFTGFELEVSGDTRRAVVPGLTLRLWTLTNGTYADLAGTVVVRAHSQLDLEFVPQVSRTDGEPRFVEKQAGDRLLFGRLNAVEIGGTMRVTYTFSPRLTLQGYAQVFAARGRYSEFSSYQAVATSRPAIRLRDLSATDGQPIKDPNFQRAAVNGSLVLRWEFSLGSTLYFVYSRSQNPNVPLAPGETPMVDFSAISRASAADALLLKISYWRS